MNIENYQEMELFPLKMSDIEDTLDELKTLYDCREFNVNELPSDDLIDKVLNLL